MARLPNYDPAEHTPRMTDLALTRREMLQRTGMGMGALSLAMMLRESVFGASLPSAGVSTSAARNTVAAASPLAPRQPHFAGKAKRVIHIFASGGP